MWEGYHPKRKLRPQSRSPKSGLPLKIAAKVDKMDAPYFDREIKPLLRNSLIEFLGEIGDREKNRLIGCAMAFLHPVDWPEPFGLSLIEAMACGTPVIARNRGSIPEVVDNGVTGFIFEDNDQAVDLIRTRLPSFSREGCRRHFEKRFPARRMARDYLAVYQTVLAGMAAGKVSALPIERNMDTVLQPAVEPESAGEMAANRYCRKNAKGSKRID